MHPKDIALAVCSVTSCTILALKVTSTASRSLRWLCCICGFRSAVRARLEELGYDLTREDLDEAFARFANDQTASTEIADEATATITQADDTAANVAASVSASVAATASAPDDAAADKQDDDPARSELVVDDPVQDEPVQSDPVQNDSVQALNDIAAAIHQAQQSQIDGDASPADPDLTPALDMAVLSATIADEVRHSVSAMIAAEMPQMVRQAVVEAIREMPTAAPGQPTPKAARKTRAKPSSANKTPAKKPPAKETTGKKAVTKKATAKKAAS